MKTLTMLSLLLTVAAMAAAAESSATTQDANTSGVPVPPVPEFTKESPEAYGLALAQYMDVYDTGWKDQYSTSRMTLFDARGDSVQRRVVQLVLEGVDGDKSIVKFQSPAEIKGVAALTHEHPDTRTPGHDGRQLALPAGQPARPTHFRRQQDGKFSEHRVYLRGSVEPRHSQVRLAVSRGSRPGDRRWRRPRLPTGSSTELPQHWLFTPRGSRPSQALAYRSSRLLRQVAKAIEGAQKRRLAPPTRPLLETALH